MMLVLLLLVLVVLMLLLVLFLVVMMEVVVLIVEMVMLDGCVGGVSCGNINNMPNTMRSQDGSGRKPSTTSARDFTVATATEL